MFRPHLPKEAGATVQSKKAIRDDLINPRPSENVTGITNFVHILDNPHDPPASLSPEELRNLKAHHIEVERLRSLALAYHQRNTIQ